MLSFLKNSLYLLLALLSSPAYGQLLYPDAMSDSVTDNYFGTIVHDPYRWLEKDTLTRSREWLAAETSLSDKYLRKLCNKYGLEQQLRYNSYADFGARNKFGRYYFEYVKDEDELSASLFLFKKPNAPAYKVVNPADYSDGANDRVTITDFALSADSKYIAFSLSHNGSDWKEIHVTGIFPFHKEKDVLTGIKYTNVEWDAQGFFYLRYPLVGNIHKDSSRNGALYYHKLGTQQKEDSLIFDDKDDDAYNIDFQAIAQGKYLIIYHYEADGCMVLSKDLSIAGASFDTITRGIQASFRVLGEYKGKWLVKTHLESPKGRLVLFSKKVTNEFAAFVPQYKEVLCNAYMVGNKVVCSYLSDADYVIITFDSTGKPVNHIDFPTGTSVDLEPDPSNDSVLLFNYISFLHPPIVYKLNVNSFSVDLVDRTTGFFDHTQYDIDKVYYTSKDGQKIPMMIAHRKGFKKYSKCPTLLYGYGGYGTVTTPFYDAGFVSFLQNGGIVALPCLRGGGEYGEAWHMQGSLHNKQSGFDDFIAAAEYLFAEQYTSSEKLAIMGGSNGGLLIASVVNQRPDICRVAILSKGIYDMLRYEKFTGGSAWHDEFGRISRKDDFDYLYKYSPLHNVRDTVYPAMLVTTADNDDRVVPLHSYKYVAALQRHSRSNNPILLHIEEHQGHTDNSIAEEEQIYSFIYEQLGIPRSKLFKY